MGIRVDEDSLVKQLETENCLDRLQLPYHQQIMNKNYHTLLVVVSVNQDYVCYYLKSSRW